MTVTVLDRALVTGERQERPDPEVPEKGRRRTFTAQYKLACVWKQLLAAPSQISGAVDLRSMTK